MHFLGADMSEGSERLSKAIEAVPDLSSTNANKWDPVYPVLTELVGLTKDQMYLAYINKSGNTQVRISKQMPTDRPVRLALGICGGFGDWTSRSYPAQAARAIISRSNLNCVVFLWRQSNSLSSPWVAKMAFHRAGSREAAAVASLWPDIQLFEVAGATSPSREGVIDADFTESVVHLLRANMNVVLEGVPGTGKSYAVKDVVRRWHEITGRELAESSLVVLHPSSSYEDLVEGLRPKAEDVEGDYTDYGEGSVSGDGFVAQLGRFTRAAASAAKDPKRDYLLVMDELNRANVPRALGELLVVMESTKRAKFDGEKWVPPADGEVRLTYTGTRFWVPDNLYILATMNTTDRSVAPLDSALRRRFVFKRLEPLGESKLNTSVSELTGDRQTWFDLVVDAWATLNDDLLRPVIGPDAVLGHSYLFDLHRELERWGDDYAHAACESFVRHSLVPQLIDSISTNGREVEIFDRSWSPLAEPATAALATLDALLEMFGMRIALEGDGLARRLSLVARADPAGAKEESREEGGVA